nr:transposase [Acidaminococcus fermentans]
MTNNICERAIRNFTIGQKSWLFSASPKGAEASAVKAGL